jgi:hypothetical protein
MPFSLAAIRSTVEFLALPTSEQVERISRGRSSPSELVRTSMQALRTALDDPRPQLSSVPLLRLEALAHELDSLSGEPAALLETPDAVLRHSSWTVVRHLAAAALRDPGWPRNPASS